LKDLFKKIAKPLLIVSLILLFSCEKDLYEDKISNTSKDKMRYVTINDVPFLKPTLEKYNPSYNYLSNPNITISNKNASDLKLDLNHIIEYLAVNGLKSYSIPIKNEFEEDKEDYYFENLHVLQIDGDFKTFIAKYNQTNDSEKFETSTFTGKIELLDINQTPIDSLTFFNGQKMVDPTIPTPTYPDDDEATGATGNAEPDPNHGWIWNLFHSIFYGASWNGNGGGTGYLTENESGPGTGGIFIILDTGGTQPIGEPITPPANNYGGGSIVIVPNQPSWPEFMTNLHMRANLICQRLEITDSTIQPWLQSIPKAQISLQIYDYLLENNVESNYYIANAFMRDVINRIKQNPSVFNTIKPFIIEKQINSNQLDPCPQGVFNRVKNSTVCDIAQVIAKIGTSTSVYNTTIKSDVAPNNQPAQTVWNSPYNYTIYISTDYTEKTKLFIAASMFHEMIHAYFMSLFDDNHNANPPDLSTYNDFAYLYHYYVTLNKPTSIDPADYHHQQMATDYVDAIARALQEYQTGIPLPAISSPEQIYSDMAWGGLSQTPVFNTLYPDGSSDRQRILNRYAAEQTGHPVGEGTSQVQTSIGQPCN
jgi:hypothetical protein